jgi:Fe-coproporphyrin III synthase
MSALPTLTPRLPLVTLYLSDRCNSRCVTCDYWRHGRDHLPLESVQGMLPGLTKLGTRFALLSGGEPLLNPQWREIAATLRTHGLRLWLLTSGLSLAKHAAQLPPLFESVTVSLDGTSAATYRAIRGLDAFEVVCQGIRAAVRAGIATGLRVTVQRANYRELPEFVRLARGLGVTQISFLAVDVGNPHAFGRESAFGAGLVPEPGEVAELGALIDSMQREFAAEFASGFIAESPHKLRGIRGYFAALLGQGEFPPVRCNAPEFSAVINTQGRMAPCFFIPGPAAASAASDPAVALEGESMRALRAEIRAGRRAECQRCVCSMWREPAELHDLSLRQHGVAS